MDLSKLDDEQIKVALKVIASAKKHGINPDFVLPMVNQESGFKPDAFSGKAYGPMQLTPSTAKELGVDPMNVDENIDGGMRYLKGLIENKKFGGDPRNIFAAYNAGPNATFFSTGDLSDLPKETVNHVIKIMGAYGENVPSISITPQEPEKAAPEPSSVDSPENQYGSTLIGGETSDESKKGKQSERDTSALEAGVIASLIGGGVGSIYEAKYPAVRLAQRVGLLPGGKAISPADAVELAERVMNIESSIPAAEKAKAPKSLVETAARKPHGGENWVKSLTNVNIPNAQMDKASLDLGKGMQNAISGGEPGFTGGKITEGGIIVNSRVADILAKDEEVAAKKAQRMAELEAAAAEREEGIRDRTKQVLIKKALNEDAKFQQMLQSANKPNSFAQSANRMASSAPVMGSLAGLGVGFNAQDAYNKFDQGDYIGGSLASGAAGASGLSVVPKLARFMGPAAIGLTAASQVAGDLKRGDKQSAAESGLSGLAAILPRIFGPLGSAVYSRGLNEDEQEELEKRRKDSINPRDRH